jgi:hypothetical protein
VQLGADGKQAEFITRFWKGDDIDLHHRVSLRGGPVGSA